MNEISPNAKEIVLKFRSQSQEMFLNLLKNLYDDGVVEPALFVLEEVVGLSADVAHLMIKNADAKTLEANECKNTREYEILVLLFIIGTVEKVMTNYNEQDASEETKNLMLALAKSGSSHKFH